MGKIIIDGAPEVPQVSDFKRGLHPFPDFSLKFDLIVFGNITRENVVLEARYDKHIQLSLLFREEALDGKLYNNDGRIYLKDKKLPESVELLATRTEYNQNGIEINLTPTTEPLLLYYGKSAVEVEAVVMNGPEIRFAGHEVIFGNGDYQLTLTEFPIIKELRNQQKRLNREYIATGRVVLSRKDRAPIEPATALEKLSHLDRFLTFVKGAHCGVGNIIGHSGDGSAAFTYLGFLRMDQFKVATGWCDLTVVKSLPEIYELYTAAIEVEADKRAILSAIEFYRASNVTRETSIEMAIVASHAALETIVPHLLRSRAGWSINLLKNREISFHDKLRAAANFIGITVNPYEHLENIVIRSKQQSNVDAYELLSIFRNRIVHQTKPFIYNGREIVEVWSLSQWIFEVMLLYWFGYRGEMNDRRKLSGWRGDAISPVPF